MADAGNIVMPCFDMVPVTVHLYDIQEGGWDPSEAYCGMQMINEGRPIAVLSPWALEDVMAGRGFGPGFSPPPKTIRGERIQICTNCLTAYNFWDWNNARANRIAP